MTTTRATLEQGDTATLGEKYEHVLHGRVGIATAQCTYLTGCDHVMLEWTDKDGEIKKEWFDILSLVPSGRHKRAAPATQTRKRSGGPAAHPSGRGPA